jgi:hypothetical protein
MMMNACSLNTSRKLPAIAPIDHYAGTDFFLAVPAKKKNLLKIP